ncbi:MAG TPA: flagellar assembly protein FliX [Rhizomicrobium sp.]|nr:flagellar assembly protein FliX [Rhizomicrobium sp.]
MEIKGPGPVGNATYRRITRAGGSSDGAFKTTETNDAGRAQTVTGPGPIAAVETILTLQGFDDATDGNSKGVAHGQDLLAMLDQVRDGLLAGSIPRSTLSRLAAAVSKRQDSFVDPKLQSVLDEIDLRARVELAKLERADAKAA